MLSRQQAATALAACGFAPSLYAASKLQDRRIICNLIINSLVSTVGFFVTVRIIPVLKPVMLRANLFGMDINKKGTLPLVSCGHLAALRLH